MCIKQLPWFGLVFMVGMIFGRLALPSWGEWELRLVHKDDPRQSSPTQSTQGRTAAVPLPASPVANAGVAIKSPEPAVAQAPGHDALPSSETSSEAGARPAAFEDPDQPPVFAPPPHLTEPEFDSLFEVQDHIDERVENLAAMIADMERDGLPADHIAFMREALLAEENVDDGSFDTLFDEPEPTDEEREANIVESYSEAGAAPEDIEEMLEIMREGFENAENPAADWDLHNPPAPLD